MVQKNLATKNDLKKALNNAVKNLVTTNELKADIRDLKEELEEKINHLPTKAEFYNSMDKLMGELEIIREENTVSVDMKRQVNDHEERLEAVEEKLKISVLTA